MTVELRFGSPSSRFLCAATLGAVPSLVNQAAKFWYISNEQGTVPLVVRSAVGAGGRFGAIHSQIHAT